jgi:hypothetical protein
MLTKKHTANIMADKPFHIRKFDKRNNVFYQAKRQIIGMKEGFYAILRFSHSLSAFGYVFDVDNQKAEDQKFGCKTISTLDSGCLHNNAGFEFQSFGIQRLHNSDQVN